MTEMHSLSYRTFIKFLESPEPVQHYLHSDSISFLVIWPK